MFKGIGNFASMLKQAQEIGGRLQSLNDELKSKRAVASVAGGMVEVEVNGLGEVLRVTLEPSLVARQDKEMLEDLIPAAVNQAVAKSKELHSAALRSMTGDMDMPGLNEMLGKLGE